MKNTSISVESNFHSCILFVKGHVGAAWVMTERLGKPREAREAQVVGAAEDQLIAFAEYRWTKLIAKLFYASL